MPSIITLARFSGPKHGANAEVAVRLHAAGMMPLLSAEPSWLEGNRKFRAESSGEADLERLEIEPDRYGSEQKITDEDCIGQCLSLLGSNESCVPLFFDKVA